MAALSKVGDIAVRAAGPGEGRAIAGLWRELWDAHEGWGGYPGSHDDRVYGQLAGRLEEDARVRAGQPVLGRHVHLIATWRGEVAGQVEGWFERHGIDGSTPYTCEVRSLIVRARSRTGGLGRALLDELAQTARRLGRGGAVVLAAEVLEPNPAHSFYAKCGYAPVSYNQRIVTSLGAAVPMGSQGGQGMTARVADPRDALAIAMLESTLAARRRAAGDVRFDRPRAVDATLVAGISAHLERSSAGDPSELVSVDARGNVRGSATLAVALLEPPFLPVKRAILGRFAIDPACDPTACVSALVALASRMAASRGAPTMELTDLTAPGTAIYQAAMGAGAKAWSRVVERTLG
jgi:GNAT superfamily N-acetyltransferase